MKRFKQMLSMLLVVSLLVSLLPATGLTAYAAKGSSSAPVVEQEEDAEEKEEKEDKGMALLAALPLVVGGVAVGGAVIGLGCYFLLPIWSVQARVIAPEGARLKGVRVAVLRGDTVVQDMPLPEDGVFDTKLSYGNYTLTVYGKMNGEAFTVEAQCAAGPDQAVQQIVLGKRIA